MRNASSPWLAAPLALAVLVLAGCGEADPDEPVTELDTAALSATAETEGGVEVPAYSEEVRTVFTATEEGSPARGTLRLLVPTRTAEEDAEDAAGVEADLESRLHVELAGLEPGVHAWAIHDVPCEITRPSVAIHLGGGPGQGVAGPLMVEADGTVEAQVDLPALREWWVEAGNYSVRIYEGEGTELGTPVVCATL